MNTPDSSKSLIRWRAAAGSLAHSTLRLENAWYEHRLKIRTHGVYNWSPGDWTESEHLFYYATSYRRIFRILDALRLAPSDTFIDLGCGKGRVACCAAFYPVREVIGIDDVPELCAAAERNLRNLRGRRAKALILRGKAEEFDYSQGTIIYMFHPFGPQTLSAVLSRLAEGLLKNRRDVRLVYVNPVHESVLRETEWLERYDHWPAERRLWTDIMHPVSFWKSRSWAPL
jgi:precorrin-6B methylase 2